MLIIVLLVVGMAGTALLALLIHSGVRLGAKGWLVAVLGAVAGALVVLTVQRLITSNPISYVKATVTSVSQDGSSVCLRMENTETVDPVCYTATTLRRPDTGENVPLPEQGASSEFALINVKTTDPWAGTTVAIPITAP